MKNLFMNQAFLFFFLCVSSAVEAGEAAAEEREDALQGPLGV